MDQPRYPNAAIDTGLPIDLQMQVRLYLVRQQWRRHTHRTQAMLIAGYKQHKTRARYGLTQRMDWATRVRSLRPKDFYDRYRMPQEIFNAVVDKIEPFMPAQCPNNPNPISIELRLSMALRYAAGTAWQDIVDIHGVSKATFFGTDVKPGLWRTFEAICQAYDLPLLDLLDKTERTGRLHR